MMIECSIVVLLLQDLSYKRKKIRVHSLFLVQSGHYILRTVKMLIGILHGVLVKVKSFIYPANFVILDCEVEFEVSIILGRPFLATCRALVDMEKGQMKFQLNNEEATFNICRSMRQSGELQLVSAISHKEKMKKGT